MKRVAKFEKVSYEQFEAAWKDSFGKPSMITDKSIKDAYYPKALAHIVLSYVKLEECDQNDTAV